MNQLIHIESIYVNNPFFKYGICHRNYIQNMEYKGYQDKQQKDNNQINVYDKVQCRVSVKSHG